MIKTALSGPDSLFCVDPQWSLRTASCSTRSSCTGPCNTKSGTRRGWSAHSSWTRSSTMSRVRACSHGCKASLVTVITQDTLVKTHLLFRVFVVVFSLITSRWVAAAAASSARSDAFLHCFLARSVAATRRILVGVSVHHSCGCVSFLVCKATPLFVLPCSFGPAQHAHAVFALVSDHG